MTVVKTVDKIKKEFGFTCSGSAPNSLSEHRDVVAYMTKDCQLVFLESFVLAHVQADREPLWLVRLRLRQSFLHVLECTCS